MHLLPSGLLSLLFAFFFCSVLAQERPSSGGQVLTYGGREIPVFSDEDLIQRLQEMTTKMLRPRFNSVVKSYINAYTVRNRERTEAMLGRSALYFPVFEKYLLENNMPLELRCLPIVESALNPNAISRARAVGLWQFMAETAKDFDLRINSYVDERKDPHRSTEAALEFLAKLYERYDDWALALAAYNSGPGRVNRAIRRGRSRDFWRIRRYLPRETRNYVPAFIASLYIWNYFHLHGLYPQYPELDMQMTDAIKVYEKISLSKVAEITGLPADVVRKLNPSYKRGVIPASQQGYNLILPRSVMAYMLNHLERPDSKKYLESSFIPAPSITAGSGLNRGSSSFIKSTYTVQSGDELESLAKLFKCSITNLKVWNGLTSDKINAGQDLIIYTHAPKRATVERLSPLPRREAEMLKIDDRLVKPLAFPLSFLEDDKFLYHYLRPGESLRDVARHYPAVKLGDLIRLNKDAQKGMKAGERIRVKEK
jgi:membrane-bound lytic murein transglycosylase D